MSRRLKLTRFAEEFALSQGEKIMAELPPQTDSFCRGVCCSFRSTLQSISS